MSNETTSPATISNTENASPLTPLPKGDKRRRTVAFLGTPATDQQIDDFLAALKPD